MRLTPVVLVVTAALAGCAGDPESGYAFTSAFREDIRTVGVPIWGNDTFHHGLEFDLTDAIVKEIHARTPWRVAPAEAADTVLTGLITQAELLKLNTQSESGFVQELGVEVTVAFEWKRAGTGEVLVARRQFTGVDSFVPARGAREALETGQSRVVAELARDIVAELRSSW